MLLQRRNIFLLAVLASAALLALAMHGGMQTRRAAPAILPAAQSPRSAADAAAELPDDLDLVIVVDHASELRDTPIGRGVRTFLAEAGGLDEMVKAWKSLADQLGWSEDVAFDRLVGRRVVLVFRADPAGLERRWAILSDVSLETEQRLKERLQAAPRSIDAGHQILSVENGQYELASHRRSTARASAGGGKSAGVGGQPAPEEAVTIVLGPVGKGDMFDRIVRVLANGAERPLGKRDVIAKAQAAGQSEVLVLAQMPARSSLADPEVPDVEQRWRDFVVLAGRRTEAAATLHEPLPAPGAVWQSRVLVRDTSRRVDLEKIQPTSDAPFMEMERDALLAVVQAAPLSDVLGPSSPIATILGGLPMPESAKALVAGRQAIRLRTVEPRQRMVCTVAMETPDTNELAKSLDGAIARGVQTVEQRFGVVAPPPRDYGGLAPQATRVVPLSIPDSGAIKLVSSEPLTVSWCYPADAAARNESSLHPGWWALSLSQGKEGDTPCPAASLRDDARALTSKSEKAEIARWVCLAAAKPAQLEAMLPSILPDIRNVRTIMRRFDRLNVRLSITEAGDIQGDIAITLPAESK